MFDNRIMGRALIRANALFTLGLAVVACVFGCVMVAQGAPAMAVALVSAAGSAAGVMAAINLHAVMVLRKIAARSQQPAARSARKPASRKAKRKAPAKAKAKAPKAPKPAPAPISDPDIAAMIQKVEAAKARLRTTPPTAH